jgi:hypothetical protein
MNVKMPSMPTANWCSVSGFHNPRQPRDIEPFRVTHHLADVYRLTAALRGTRFLSCPTPRPECRAPAETQRIPQLREAVTTRVAHSQSQQIDLTTTAITFPHSSTDLGGTGMRNDCRAPRTGPHRATRHQPLVRRHRLAIDLSPLDHHILPVIGITNCVIVQHPTTTPNGFQ